MLTKHFRCHFINALLLLTYLITTTALKVGTVIFFLQMKKLRHTEELSNLPKVTQ